MTKYVKIVTDVYINMGEVTMSITGYGISNESISIGPIAPIKSSLSFNYFSNAY